MKVHPAELAHGARARRAALLACALATAPLVQAADNAHDNVQTRSDCAFAASRSLGTQALVFLDPPQPAAPRATDLAGEYYWHAVLVSQHGERTPVWLHCEIIPGSTATYAEVLLRGGASP